MRGYYVQRPPLSPRSSLAWGGSSPGGIARRCRQTSCCPEPTAGWQRGMRRPRHTLLDELCEKDILIDCIYVFEYAWLAAWCFFGTGDADAEIWVQAQVLAILQGKPV